MFGLFASQCPASPRMKVWAEIRFRDLVNAVGLTHIRDVDVLVPGHPELPQDYHGSDDCIRKVFDLVCTRMGLAAGAVEYEIVPSDILDDIAGASPTPGGGVHGLYIPPDEVEAEVTERGTLSAVRRIEAFRATQDAAPSCRRPRILISETLRDDPERLLAVIAHEAAHDVVRVRVNEIESDEDMEQCVDVLPVLFGFGVYMANSTLREGCEESGGWFYWGWSKSGYLTAEVYGYVLALFAFVREEIRPAWAGYLRLDARAMTKRGLKYLLKTQDCLFDPNLRGALDRQISADDLQGWLSSPSTTWQMFALFELFKQQGEISDLQTEISRLLESRESDLRVMGAWALSTMDGLTCDAHQALLMLRHDGDEVVRRQLPYALRPGSPNDEMSVAALVKLMADDDLQTAQAAIEALIAFPDIPESVQYLAPDVLRRMLATGGGHGVQLVLSLLHAMELDVEKMIAEHFGDDHDWLLELSSGPVAVRAEAGIPTRWPFPI